MKKLFFLFTVLALIGTIPVSAQLERIFPDQVNAIRNLSHRQGFTDETLNQYLREKYGSTLENLTNEDGAELITLFQGNNPPQPYMVRPSLPAATTPTTPLIKRPEKILEVGMSKRFHLVNGNIVDGTITALEKDFCRIETIDGTLDIPKDDILEETVTITKKNGSRYDGPIIKETPEEIVVRSEYGDVVISKKDIRDMDRYHGGQLVPKAKDTKRFYQGEAKLINNFLDPTAFVLDAQTFYLSGLSVGYGFTERFMLTTKFGSGFAGDLNIEPKVRLYHRQTGTSEQAVALGVSLHRRFPMSTLVAKYSHAIKDSVRKKSINRIDSISVDDVLVKPEDKRMYGEAYLTLSSRRSLGSGRGKIGWTVGFKTNSLPLIINDVLKDGYIWDKDAQFVIPFRTWASIEYDLRKNLKFVGSIWADNGNKVVEFGDVWEDYTFDGTPFVLDSPKGYYSMFDFDFGFLYALGTRFRIGVHFQQPYLDFYWEFLEF